MVNAPVKGIVFDLEGTVIDLEALHHKAHLYAALDVGLKLSLEEAIQRLPHFVGGPDEEVAAEIASLSNKKVTAQDILLAKRKYFDELLQQSPVISPREGFAEFVNWIKHLGFETAIGTVTNRIRAIQYLQRAGLSDIFDQHLIVAREDVSLPKPHPDVYYETARRLEILPENQLVFEDSTIGLKSARSAGCRVIAMPTIQSDYYIQSLYREGAEAVFNTWNDPDIRPHVSKILGV